MSDIFEYMLGRQAATHPIGYQSIFEYVDALPAADAVFDHTNGFNGFKMLGNGPDPSLTIDGGRPKGDCAFVGTVNVGVIDEVETGTPVTIPTSDLVVGTYDTYDHGQDLGANLSQLLAYQYNVGLPWLKGAPYAAVSPKDVDEFWSATEAFGCTYIGIAVTEAMQRQTQNGEPWDVSLTGNDIVGGHCVVCFARDANGGTVATWGMRQKFTTRWFKKYVEEAHVILTPSQVTKGSNGYGLDLAHLKADLAKLPVG